MDNKKKKWIVITVAIVVVTNIASLFLGGRFLVFAGNSRVAVDKDTYDTVQKFSKLFSVRDQLYKYYDGKISDSVLLDGALKGMTSSLKDPYTVYMDKSETKSFNSEIQGQQYVGLGMEVQAKDNKVIVSTVFDNSPAEKAGMKSGDVIVKVNGTDAVSTDLEKTVSMIKGKEGTSVTLTLYRSTKGNFDITAKRQKVAIDTVSGEMLSNEIGYMQVSMFDENTGNNFNKKIDELKQQGMKGLILDLRSNPGGLLSACIQVTSNFVTKDKVIVSTIDKYNSKEEYKSKGGNYIGLPLVVLVDGNTASASEIFSGAIRDYKLGTLIGEKTFGKGVVQAPFDLNDGTQLKITISKYYTPNGENIHHKGIKPDIEVKYPDTLKDKPYDRNSDPQFQKALEQIKSKMK
ncbi:carboxyl-terminal processing protease [Clostridium acetobutylicum]|uniref:Carboxyl-terminal protease n=1 Tax=Clostridium acetobutylicum (strain ATCC 824 / DSM 792 / JCM 1419 / IAM 19013 / LMG 5710 / NBRC 13948 / NRRL B-527 / VKM B-1787 / 2291 / W) TaxID=272562 RepID=Q97LQ5_CLOAB|nr:MULTISPECIES: S41 family peptidase [Clostridium]AAK78479.1 Carboxyl-terminal protease [Clostridium acetobutylicum ATCC 824]AEI31277.1 carboxyl-terminal protease [Clostridium acetobutylicum DSM 1731]AWV80200.1 S41 family peptidase [Clostridium acetobutylicum]MBC2392382.1 S41 family peptidase [Clostridium acetobutylicum]MBC2583676.1 S41 family peptidase [Clostridium acetobutylicum]